MPKKDEWNVAIDRVLKICDEMIAEADYKAAAVVTVLREKLLKLKKGSGKASAHCKTDKKEKFT